jgi:hypothetical protein
VAITPNGGNNYPFSDFDATAVASAYSVHFLAKSTSAPAGGGNRKVVTIHNGAGTCDIGFAWDHNNAAFQKAAYHRTGAGAFPVAKLTSAISANTWYAMGSSYDGSNIRAYLNGALETTSAAAAAPFTDAASFLVSFGPSPGSSAWTAGTCAELGVWNATLTVDEFAALASGFSPLLIRPQSLLAYRPYIGSRVNLRGETTPNEVGTPVYVDHPRVIGR